MNNKKRFSIIIPTRGRHQFLRRTLDYLIKQGCEYDIIIGDSSGNDFDYSLYNVNYYNFPQKFSHIDRIFTCAKKVGTPYVMLLGDDDFINLSIIPKICDFLDKNPDYSSVDGKEIRVRCDEQGIEENIFHVQKSLNNNDIMSRVESHCKEYWPTFYCVHRKDVLIKSLQVMKDNEPSGYLFQELASSISTIIQGKYHTFDELYIIRQNFHMQSTAATWWTDLLRDGDFKKRNNLLISTLVKVFSHDIRKNDLQNAINKYYRPFKIQNREKEIKKILEFIIPQKILVHIKSLKRKLSRNKGLSCMNDVYVNDNFYDEVKKILSIYPFGKI